MLDLEGRAYINLYSLLLQQYHRTISLAYLRRYSLDATGLTDEDSSQMLHMFSYPFFFNNNNNNNKKQRAGPNRQQEEENKNNNNKQFISFPVWFEDDQPTFWKYIFKNRQLRPSVKVVAARLIYVQYI